MPTPFFLDTHEVNMMNLSISRRQSLLVLAPCWIVCWVVVLWMLTTGTTVAADGPLVTYDQAARVGLERAWFAQVGLDTTQNRISNWFLYGNRLYSVSTGGTIFALDAETGKTLWSSQVGKAGHISFGPGANDKYIATVSGSQLHLLESDTGRIAWSRYMGSAPSSGPALSERHAFVAMVTGRIEGYLLEDPHKPAWYSQSVGHTYLSPTTTDMHVTWPTDRGYLYVCRPDPPGVIYRLETGDEIVTPAVSMGSDLLVGSMDSYLYCINALNGNERWRYATGYPISSKPATVSDRVFVASLQPMLHVLDGESGKPVWTALGVTQFVARGQERIYALDQNGDLQVFDAQSGGNLGRLKVSNRLRLTDSPTALVNDQTDRIFLVDDMGLVQCLRETGADEPTLYRKRTVEESAEGEKPEAAEEQPAEEAPAEPNPFATEAAPGAEPDGGSPFGQPAPAEEEPEEDDNPFGDFNPFGM